MSNIITNEDLDNEINNYDYDIDKKLNYQNINNNKFINEDRTIIKMNNLRLSSESDADSVSNTSHISNLDVTGNSEEEEEKQRLIERVLELQSTLEDLSKKVTEVKEENLKLKSENQILGNYIENLMQTSNVFQSTWQNKTLTKK